MHPTIDEQLRGAARLLEVLNTTIPVSEDAQEVLANVTRLVRQAQRAAVSAPTFYRGDNAQLAALLQSLGSDVPVGPESGADDAAVAQRNVQLRRQLCQVIEHLPPDTQSASARVDIGRYLLRRVDQDPV